MKKKRKAKGQKPPKLPTPKQASPFVNVVVLDNSVPGGFRYEQRPTDAAQTQR